MQLHHRFAALGDDFFLHTRVQPLAEQRLVEGNADLANFLGVDLKDDSVKAVLSGAIDIPETLSMVYAGHQFGGFTPRLGDGRGVLLGEVQAADGSFHDLHVKGAGQTPYSRMGDGRAVLRSCIREYLCSEAMHGLGIATTRALALFDSREAVYREKPEPGAMLVRTARTHIRFGHFEYFFAHQRYDNLDQLIDYTLANLFPQCATARDPIEAMFIDIVERTAVMIANWQAVGFQHGVMNTDNFSIIGDTIDYGPFGFMEDYDPKWICNHSDYEGRYAFQNQPSIGLWNLNCLARCFSRRLSREQLINALQQYEPKLQSTYDQLMAAKLGLSSSKDVESLLDGLWTILRQEQMDYTLFWRKLCACSRIDNSPVLDEVIDRQRLQIWLEQYWERRDDGRDQHAVALEMYAVNPKFILRNYLAHHAIEAAEQGNYLPMRQLLKVLATPFDEHSDSEQLAKRPPDWGRKLEVSCSS